MTAWAAPEATSAVDAVVALPGSKSLTNRLLVLAALADGPSRIDAPLRARDSLLMVAALRGLGVEIADETGAWTVTPGGLHGGNVDVGLSGTVMRFVPPLAGLATGRVDFDGDAYARERPMATLVDGLRQAGIEVQDDGRDRLPFAVLGAGTAPGGSVRIDASASSQFVSGLLLTGARFDKGLELVHAGDRPVPSQPHLDMTVDVLRTAGVELDDSTPGTWLVAPGPISAREWRVEPDLSNAGPFLAAALVTGGSVTVPGWPRRTTQAGDALRELLGRMGGDVVRTDEGLTIRGTGVVHGIDADLGDVGELTPTIAALAALADSPSTLRGIAHLRGHETDRLAALRTELTALGGDVSEEPDGLTIRPRPLGGGTWHAYADHRMATAGAVLGLLVPGVEVDDIASTTKTLPDFAGMWSAMLGA